MVKDYNPNISWATHTWELTFQMWEYKIVFTEEIDGNCRGMDTLDAAISSLATKLHDEYGDYPEIQMKRTNPDTWEEEILFTTLGEDGIDSEDELKAMLVSAILINHVEEKK